MHCLHFIHIFLQYFVTSFLHSLPYMVDENKNSLQNSSGKLTVKQPLEFERIPFLPGNIGSITLIIEAKDKGSPARSSTVSVAVNLQVC